MGGRGFTRIFSLLLFMQLTAAVQHFTNKLSTYLFVYLSFIVYKYILFTVMFKNTSLSIVLLVFACSLFVVE